MYDCCRNKSLRFAYLLTDKYMEWFKCLLEQTVPEGTQLTVKAADLDGTVICVHGAKKYFCLYHYKPDTGRGDKCMSPSQGDKDTSGGSFLGFDEDSSTEDRRNSSGHRDRSAVLDGLPLWLERLMDGTTRRFHIQYWPELQEI